MRAPTHIQEQFHELLDQGVAIPYDLLSRLHPSTDALPDSYCMKLGIPKGSTYRQAVDHTMAQMTFEELAAIAGKEEVKKLLANEIQKRQHTT